MDEVLYVAAVSLTSVDIYIRSAAFGLVIIFDARAAYKNGKVCMHMPSSRHSAWTSLGDVLPDQVKITVCIHIMTASN